HAQHVAVEPQLARLVPDRPSPHVLDHGHQRGRVHGASLPLGVSCARRSAMAKEKPAVVSHEEWVAARKALLVEEKAHFRAGDAIAAKRRALPWVKMDRYVFEGVKGKVTLEQLFGKKGQLVVYHFMFPPEDKEGCKHCSFWADHFDGARV